MSTLIIQKRIVEINYNADAWDLYSLPGRQVAAKEVNEAIKKAFNDGRGAREVRLAAMEIMSKWKSVGMLDSEAYGKLDRIMDKLFPITE